MGGQIRLGKTWIAVFLVVLGGANIARADLVDVEEDDASGGVAVSLHGEARCTPILAPTPAHNQPTLCAAVSVFGDAVSSCMFVDCVAVSATNDSYGGIAVSPLGYAVGETAVSAAGNSRGWGYGAVSLTGNASGEYAAVTGSGDARSRSYSISGTGDANGTDEGAFAISGTGNATSVFLAASGTGNARGSVGVSVLESVMAFDPVRTAGDPWNVSGATGAPWGAWVRQVTDSTPSTWWWPEDAAMAGDRLHVVFYDARWESCPDLPCVTYAQPAVTGWHQEIIEENALARSIAVDSKGVPHVAYSRFGESGWYACHAARLDGSWVRTCFQPGVSGYPQEIAVAITPDDRPAFAYSWADSVYYVEKGVADGWTQETVAHGVYTFTEEKWLAFDQAAAPHLVINNWSDLDNGRLTPLTRHAYRNETGVWVQEKVHGCGRDQMIAFGTDGVMRMACAMTWNQIVYAERTEAGWAVEDVNTTGRLLIRKAIEGISDFALDAWNRPHFIIWGSNPLTCSAIEDTVFYATRTNTGWSQEEPVHPVLTYSCSGPRYPQLVLDGGGVPHILYDYAEEGTAPRREIVSPARGVLASSLGFAQAPVVVGDGPFGPSLCPGWSPCVREENSHSGGGCAEGGTEYRRTSLRAGDEVAKGHRSCRGNDSSYGFWASFVLFGETGAGWNGSDETECRYDTRILGFWGPAVEESGRCTGATFNEHWGGFFRDPRQRANDTLSEGHDAVEEAPSVIDENIEDARTAADALLQEIALGRCVVYTVCRWEETTETGGGCESGGSESHRAFVWTPAGQVEGYDSCDRRGSTPKSSEGLRVESSERVTWERNLAQGGCVATVRALGVYQETPRQRGLACDAPPPMGWGTILP